LIEAFFTYPRPCKPLCYQTKFPQQFQWLSAPARKPIYNIDTFSVYEFTNSFSAVNGLLLNATFLTQSGLAL